MFKLIDDKRFFYLCATLSIIITIFASTLSSYSILSVFENVLIVIFLLAMIIFNRVEHKELMKVLTASFLQVVILKNISEFTRIAEPVLDNTRNVISLFSINHISFRGITLIVTTILLLVLFINHFVLNFNGKYSKVAININKVVMTLYLILIIIAKVSLSMMIYRNFPLFCSMTHKLRMTLLFDGIPTMIYALTVVSMEAFVNAERKNKEQNTKEIKAPSAKTAKKSTSIKKSTKKTSKKK